MEMERCGRAPERARPHKGLKLQAQRKLQVTNVVALAGNLAERAEVGRVGSNAVPIRMVEDIECLRAELEADPLVDCELLEQTQVPVIEARVVNNITGWFAGEGAKCGCGELRRLSVRSKRNRDVIAGIGGSVVG